MFATTTIKDTWQPLAGTQGQRDLYVPACTCLSALSALLGRERAGKEWVLAQMHQILSLPEIQQILFSKKFFCLFFIFRYFPGSLFKSNIIIMRSQSLKLQKSAKIRKANQQTHMNTYQLYSQYLKADQTSIAHLFKST